VKEHIFEFEILRHYPAVRSFVVKKPLKQSLGETLFELVLGKR